MKFIAAITIITFPLLIGAAPIENPIPYSSRYEYWLGTHVQTGGSTGIVGMSADIHVFDHYALVPKAGTGIYFNAAALEVRYFMTQTSFAPYIAVGVARWSHTGSPEKLKETWGFAKESGLVRSDGSVRKDEVYLQTSSVGIHYISEYGFSAALEFTGLFSYETQTFIPWGGLSFGWYF